MTGVKRSFRGRGIASALKRAEIAWAKRAGYRTLETSNDELNAPIRALNEKHGYKTTTGSVTLRRAPRT
jgi:mycothiol synthase